MLIFLFLGLISAVFQLTLFREFVFSIAKNELYFIAAVGIWLAGCSLGSLTGIKKRVFPVKFLPTVFSLIFCFAAGSIHLSKPFLGIGYHETVSLSFVFAAAFILIGAPAFLIGYSFCAFSKEYLRSRPHHRRTYANFFAWETAGLCAGGLIFTFYLSSYSNPFIFVFLPLLFFLVFPFNKIKKAFSIITIVCLGLFFVLSYEAALKKEFQGAGILMNKGTRYGPAILTKKSGVSSLYVNGSLSAASEDKAWDEEFIHTAFSAAKPKSDVLFMGPYFSKKIDEILKYEVNSIDCPDLNPIFAGDNKKVNLIITDPRVFIKNTRKKYDYIVMSVPAPSNLALNRYFSYEFFKLVKNRLKKEGIFCFYIPSKRDILGSAILKFNSCILNTLDKVFKHRILIPSDSMIVIARSVKPFSVDKLRDNFLSWGVKTEFFTKYRLEDSFSPGRRLYVENMIDRNVKINRDFIPRGFLYFSLFEQAKFYPDFFVNIEKVKYFAIGFFLTAAFLAGFLSLFKKDKAPLLNASAAGFLSIGLTTVIFILFQVYSGALFWKMGVLTAAFMMGLSAGAFLINSIAGKFSFSENKFKFFFLVWLSFILIILAGLKFSPGIFYAEFVFYICSFLCGIFTGAVYPLLAKVLLKNKTVSQNITPLIYAADLLGAFIGTFVFSIVFIPFLGVVLSLYMLAGLALIFCLRGFIPRFRG
ncbi:MAG: hypothetical protein ABIH08_06695 [Candidatus Omnitrophota bacterium]